MTYTMLADLYRADSKPGVQHRDDVELRRQQGYKASVQTKPRWGVDECNCCHRNYETKGLYWLTRTKRICLECRLENEKMRRSLIEMKRGA